MCVVQMLEQAYRTSSTNMITWISGGAGSWVARRYGSKVLADTAIFKSLSTAWRTLQSSVYSHSPMFQYSSAIVRDGFASVFAVDLAIAVLYE